MDAVFHALGDRTRRIMLRELAGGKRTVGALAEPFAMSLAAASKHIKVLEHAGLVRREVRGRMHWCSLEPEPIEAASQLLEDYRRFWSRNLDRLEALIEVDKRRKENGNG